MRIVKILVQPTPANDDCCNPRATNARAIYFYNTRHEMLRKRGFLTDAVHNTLHTTGLLPLPYIVPLPVWIAPHFHALYAPQTRILQ